MSTRLDDAALERLLRVFDQRDAEGAPRYTRDEVRAFLPVLFLSAGGGAEMSAALADVMRDFAARVGVAPGMAQAEVERRIREHFEQHPPNPRLLADVKDVLREELLQGGGLDAAAAAKALGHAMPKTPVGHGEAPAGSKKASPLARFAFAEGAKDDDEGAR